MKISSFLDRKDITVSIPVDSKREVLGALVDLLVSNHDELERDILLKVLLKREELRSTGIEQGLAFPHGRIPGLKKLLACFGRCKQGVDFDSFDGQPTHFFFVLLIPEQAEGSHLRALARLNQVFQDGSFRQRLLDAEDSNTLYDVILDQDSK